MKRRRTDNPEFGSAVYPHLAVLVTSRRLATTPGLFDLGRHLAAVPARLTIGGAVFTVAVAIMAPPLAQHS